jgi:hypothetical protein
MASPDRGYIMIIYKVTNKINLKVYIGQTTMPLKLRKASHKCAALTSHSNSYFHKAIRKYGWDSFEWVELYQCSSKEELDIKEIEYIVEHDCHASSGKGYNLTKGGDYNPMSDPDIKRRRDESLKIAMKAFVGDNNVMKRPDIIQKHQTAIDQLSKDPDWIEAKRIGDQKQKSTYEVTYPDGTIEIVTGLNKFCKDHGLQQSKMSSVVSGDRNHHKGFCCKKLTQGCKSQGSNNLNKTFYFISPNGEKVVVHNLNTFCKDNKLSYTCMLYVYQGKQETHKGYVKGSLP